MNARVTRILARVLLASFLLTMLPGAALGEGSAALSPKRNTGVFSQTALELLQNSQELAERLSSLPEGKKPLKNAIPRRCVSVKQGEVVTVSVRILRPTLSALADLRIQLDSSKLLYQGCTLSIQKSSVTIRLKLMAIGAPCTTRIRYRSVRHPSLKRRTYVTIKKGAAIG